MNLSKYASPYCDFVCINQDGLNKLTIFSFFTKKILFKMTTKTYCAYFQFSISHLNDMRKKKVWKFIKSVINESLTSKNIFQ